MELKQEKKGNIMLDLIEKIQQQTEGMCTVGSGPYGFGITNSNLADIGICFHFNPDPIDRETIFPEWLQDYEVCLVAFGKASQRALGAEEVAALTQDKNAATAKVATLVEELSGQPYHVTREECVDAFDILTRQALEEAGMEMGETQEGMGGMVMG